jgi:hypothetical protein
MDSLISLEEVRCCSNPKLSSVPRRRARGIDRPVRKRNASFAFCCDGFQVMCDPDR